jgi:pyruvate formate lyase activating enzyme
MLKNVKKIEVLPYHRLGVEKYKKLGINYGLEGVQEPSKESIDMAKKILEIKGENND